LLPNPLQNIKPIAGLRIAILLVAGLIEHCCNRVKIVAMTANTIAEDRENCILTGMDDFIDKPIRIDELDAVQIFG
jgi:CheY-like chemotaxis protein